MQVQRIKRFETIELTIGQNNPGDFTFDTIAQLRNQPDQIIIITGIQVYPDTVYSNSFKTGTVPGMPVTEMVKAALTLYVDGEQSIKLIPLGQLVNINNTNQPSIFQQEIQTFADLQNVDFEMSGVRFSVAPAGTPYVIPFGITYLRMKRNPEDPSKWIDA